MPKLGGAPVGMGDGNRESDKRQTGANERSEAESSVHAATLGVPFVRVNPGSQLTEENEPHGRSFVVRCIDYGVKLCD